MQHAVTLFGVTVIDFNSLKVEDCLEWAVKITDHWLSGLSPEITTWLREETSDDYSIKIISTDEPFIYPKIRFSFASLDDATHFRLRFYEHHNRDEMLKSSQFLLVKGLAEFAEAGEARRRRSLSAKATWARRKARAQAPI